MVEVIQLWSPLIQGGFAVFALLLLGVNVWLVKQLLAGAQGQQPGDRRQHAGHRVGGHDRLGYQGQLMQEIRDELLKRPCLMDECGHDE